ncbi:MAG: DUF262 domain-containing protein [Ignavibacteria bacterium]|nr:DUF262 domain-containing protein [Ignavibacteria bacterium]
MNTGKYKFTDFVGDIQIEQLIIPEIQRDYVWETEDVISLCETIKESFDQESQEKPYLGFIYGYNEREFPNQLFLVDGQQRLTTMVLLILAGYKIQQKKMPNYIYSEGLLKIDYKVRKITHEFLLSFIDYINNNEISINDKLRQFSWYYDLYNNDRTISNIVNNFEAITSWLSTVINVRIKEFFNFIEKNVELSFFEIKTGREGEELYIYMNSRGKELEANETVKAEFLSLVPPEQKPHWGKRWEFWQDFFWKNRGHNMDSAIGFNEFLKMVNILQSCKKSNLLPPKSIQGNYKVSMRDLPSSMDELNEYFEAFKWIAENNVIMSFFAKYEREAGNYFCYTGARKLIDYFKILPILELVKGSHSHDTNSILRFVRFFYNISRKESIAKDISANLILAIKLISEYLSNCQGSIDVCDLRHHSKGRTVILDSEEVIKLSIYAFHQHSTERIGIEKVFWEAEDHEIFNGEISFLLRPHYHLETGQFNLNDFENQFRSFKILFPNSIGRNDAQITRALLFIGQTWIKDSPYYYTNWHCQNWKKLVKSQSGKYLRILIDEFINKDISFLDQFIQQKIKDFFLEKKISTVADLRSLETFNEQMKALTSIDYYNNKRLWQGSNKYIAEQNADLGFSDTPFFSKNRSLFNVDRYVRQGTYGRILNFMRDELSNEKELQSLISKIIA